MRFPTLIISLILLASFGLPSLASAQLGTGNTNQNLGAGNTGSSVKLENPLKSGDSLSGFLNNILGFIINIGTIVLILMVVYSGYKFVMAQGNSEEISKAKTMLLWTIIGGLILLGAKAISDGILATVQGLGG